MEYNSPTCDGSRGAAKLTAYANGKNRTPDGIDKIDFYVFLDELSDDPLKRTEEITKAVLVTYEAENLAFQEKHKGKKVKNGTYSRKFIVVDPIDRTFIIVKVRMQRYLDHEETKSHVFYGSLFLPQIPILACQLLLLYGQRTAELDERKKKPRCEWQKLEELCESWSISKKAFYSYWKKIQQAFFHMEGKEGRKAMLGWLREFIFSDNQSDMAEKLRKASCSLGIR